MLIRDVASFTKQVFEVFKKAPLPALLEGNLE